MTRKQDAMAHIVQSADYHPDFPGWLHAHFDIYEEFERMALAAIRRGRIRLSAKFLFELIRWNTQISEQDTYKLNNSMASSAARLFDHLNPEHAGYFEFRQRVKVGA